MATNIPLTPLSFIWFFLKRYKAALSAFLLLQLGTGLWSPFNSLLIKWLINTLNAQGQTPHYQEILWPCMLLIANFIVFDNIVYRAADLFNYYYQGIVKNEITRVVLRHLLSQPHHFFHDNLSGALARQLHTLTDSVEVIAHKVGPQFIRGFSLLGRSLIAAYSASPVFCFLIALWFASFSVMSILMAHQLVERANHVAASESQVSGEIVDILSNQHNVRIFARQDFEITRLKLFLNRFLESFKARTRFVILLLSLQGACVIMFISGVVGALLYLHSFNAITIGDFSMILGLSISLAHTLWYIMWDFGYFNEAYGRCQHSLKALLTAVPALSRQQSERLSYCQGAITFEEISFSYPGSNPIFKNLSVHIPAAQKVGLVGYSGGGKSTFISLLLRLYQPQSGSIFLDAISLDEIDETLLHEIISVIPQDPSLFDRSLQENISYGKPLAELEEVIAAAHLALAHDFITMLPEGYQTSVGERGVKLSGGQRQRVAMARSILKNSPIIIMDEATSQLDSLTEHAIQQNLEGFLKNKTAFVIAHRLSTLISMDRILVFEGGQIIEDGTHAQLIKRRGLYFKLWSEQSFSQEPRTVKEPELLES